MREMDKNVFEKPTLIFISSLSSVNLTSLIVNTVHRSCFSFFRYFLEVFLGGGGQSPEASCDIYQSHSTREKPGTVSTLVQPGLLTNSKLTVRAFAVSEVGSNTKPTNNPGLPTTITYSACEQLGVLGIRELQLLPKSLPLIYFFFFTTAIKT